MEQGTSDRGRVSVATLKPISINDRPLTTMIEWRFRLLTSPMGLLVCLVIGLPSARLWEGTAKWNGGSFGGSMWLEKSNIAWDLA